MAHIHVNWLAPVKVRRTLIGGSQKMIVLDDLEPSEKLKIYDKGITLNGNAESVYQMMIGYRTGDMWAPNIENGWFSYKVWRDGNRHRQLCAIYANLY